MPKYRIVQVKPLGLDGAFIIESFIDVPATKSINPKYKFHQSYYEGQFKLNAGAKPQDWVITTPATQKWQELSSWYSRNTLEEAEKCIEQLRTEANLVEELKTFKRKIIREYD